LVIGAGVAGLSAALNLANQGFEVRLVEREAEAGGLLRDVHRLYPTGEDARAFIERKVEAVRCRPNIEMLLGAEVRDVHGSVGNYDVVVEQGGEQLQFKACVVIVATGGRELRPVGVYEYDGERVITQGELEGLLAKGLVGCDPSIRSVVMIQCVGARDEVRPYCSRICCMTAVKNALLIREADPGVGVYVLYRDMLTLGVDYEDLYREARGKGVVFVQYDPASSPMVGRAGVLVRDELLGEMVSIPSDLVVLSTPLVSQSDAAALARMLQVPADEHGFFSEAHLKYRPLDTVTDGVFLCGSAHWPSDVGETVAQALGAAARASILLRQDEIEAAPTVAVVDVSKCSACGLCELTCNYSAVEVMVVDERRGIKAARVDEARCKGCGACAAGCRCRAIDLRGSTNEQILAVISAF
jgi:heterodisulfide reductase subunit A